MSEPSKTKGNLNAAAGAVKENIGSMFGNKTMEAEGKVKRTEGNSEVQAAKAKGYAEGTTDRVKGMAKDTFGSVTGNEKQQAEGKLDKAKGETKQSTNQ